MDSFSGQATMERPQPRPCEANVVVCPCACLLRLRTFTEHLPWPGSVRCRAQLYFYLRLLLPRFQSRMTPHLLCASRTPGSSSGEPNLCALHMLFPLPGTSLQHPAPPCHPATLCQSNSNSSCRTQSDVTGSRSCPIVYVQRPKHLLHSTSSNGTPGT